MRRLPLFAVVLLLAACGTREPLTVPPGEQAPPKPAHVPAPTTEQMLTPPTQAAPERVNDVLRQSEDRPDDRFDLPPG
jgi:predicted small lipoprotein YifL